MENEETYMWRRSTGTSLTWRNINFSLHWRTFRQEAPRHMSLMSETPDIDCNMSGMPCLVSWTFSNKLYGVCCKYENNYSGKLPKMFRRLPTTRKLMTSMQCFLMFFISLSSNLGLMILRLIGVYRPLPYFFGGGKGGGPSLCEWPNYTTCFYLFMKT